MSVCNFVLFIVVNILLINANTLIGKEDKGVRILDESAWVHTDRDIYIAGENVFFKVYVISRDSHQLSDQSKIAYMVIRNSANFSFSTVQIKIDHGTGCGSVYLPDTLTTGIYQIVVYTNWMRNSSEDDYFHKEIIISNRFDKDLSALERSFINKGKAADVQDVVQSANTRINLNKGFRNISLSVISDQSKYRTRQKVKMSLNLIDSIADLSANLSIAVFEDEPKWRVNSISIQNYFATETSEKTIHLEHVNKSKYLPEIKNEIIQGNIIHAETNKGCDHACVLLSVPDTFANLQYDYTDSDGLFRFSLGNYYRCKDMIISVKDLSHRQGIIKLENKYALTSGFYPSVSSNYIDLKRYIQKSQNIVHVQKNYQLISPVGQDNFERKQGNCPRVYFKPNTTIFPADFVQFTDLNEMCFEILTILKIKKVNDHFIARMSDDNQHLFMEQSPAIFLDGVLINDINQIVQLGSDKINRLEFITTRYNFGNLVFPGIMAVFSKNNEISSIHPYPVSIRLKNNCIQSDLSRCNQPVMINSSIHQPDFKQLLYWNPHVELLHQSPGNFEFQTSDHIGNYTIVVEGVSSDGTPIRGFAKFIVN